MNIKKIFFVFCIILTSSCGKKSELILPDGKKKFNFQNSIETYDFNDNNDEFKYYSGEQKYQKDHALKTEAPSKNQGQEDAKERN